MPEATTWTLESELCAMAGEAPTLAIALDRLGLTSAGGEPEELRLVEAWRRGGAETYVYAFAVQTGGSSTTYLLKAFVPYPGTISVADALARYIHRAEIFRDAGVRTPRTHAWLKGTLLQEYIPEELSDAIRSGPPQRREALVISAMTQRMATEQLGFAPMQFFSDLRVDGSATVLVDLGQDLLPCESREYDPDQIVSDWKTWLWGHLPSESLREELVRIARTAVSS